MRRLHQWLRRRFQRDAEWREEIESHLTLSEDWHRERGAAGESARMLARRQFGSSLRAVEAVRAVYLRTWLETLLQDVRYAVRSFGKAPIFSIVAIVTIAIGVGASTAVFSAVDPLLFRSLPYPKDQQLVSVGYLGPVDDNEFNVVSSYVEWRARQTVFQSLTSMRPVSRCDLEASGAPEQLFCYSVEANFLATFGIRPSLGRDFAPEDDAPGAPPVALISNGLWQRRFGGEARVIGRAVTLDEESVRIIGVLPPEFEMPQLGIADLLLPERLNTSLPRSANSGSFLRTFARLRDGVSIQQAQDRMMPAFEDTVRQDVPVELRSEVRLVLRSLRDRQIHDVKQASWLLLAAVLAVLAAACANVANLLLARAAARRAELALRTAIGAGRGRLIRQMLTESLLLGLAGGVAGCGIAWVLLRTFVHLAPEGLLRINRAHLDPRVLLFALIASLVSALLFGAAPALERPDAQSLAGRNAGGAVRTLFRKSLVAAQVAISLVLLTGAALFLRSLWRLENQSLGFQPEHVTTVSFTLNRQRYRQPDTQTAFFHELETKLKRIPGAGSFALADSIPPRGSMGRPYSNLRIAGHAPLAANGGMVAFRWVTPGYFQTMGIRILAGRAFSEDERSSGPSPVILSATLARRIFGKQDPVGQQIDLSETTQWLPIVGVAADAKNNGITDAADPEYYRLRMSGDQSGNVQLPRSGVALFRTSLDPATLTQWIRHEFAALDPTLPVTVGTLAERVDRFRGRPRFIAMLISLFAAIAVLLAAVGLYGVMSFLVMQRTREIGVRMAVGAEPRDVVILVQTHAAVWTGVGMVIGLGCSFALARTIRGLLYEVSPGDPTSLAIAVAVLATVSALAAWIPSRRAARVDPIVALRQDA
jgi:putative ABC transport system permease protein